MPRKGRKKAKIVKKGRSTVKKVLESPPKDEQEISHPTESSILSSNSNTEKNDSKKNKDKNFDPIEELKSKIELFTKEKQTLENDLINKETVIKKLKIALEKCNQQQNNSRETHDYELESERWRESALIMSQFIAEKMGFTQGEILLKFGATE